MQADNAECYIDDLSIENCVTTQPWVSHLGSTRLTLNWETYGPSEAFVRYGSTLIAQATPPLDITGLNPSTSYTFTVGCPGSEGLSVTATTMEGAGMTPAYYQPFSGTTLPAGWHTPLDCTPTLSGGALVMQPSATGECLAVLPLQESADSRTLNMALRLRGDTTTRLVAGVMDYANESESFVPVDTLECTDAWQRLVVSFAPYNGQGHYLALKAVGNGTLNVDDLRVGRCLIDSVKLYNLTSNSVTFAWQTLAMADGANVKIEWGARGFTPGSGTVATATSNPFVLAGLAPGTNYDFYVSPTCGDGYCSYDKHQASTFNHSLTIPYCTGFEGIGSSLPQGWICSQGAAGGSSTSFEGSRGLRLTGASTVSLPLVNNGGDSQAVLEFYGNGAGNIEVGIMDSPFSSFQCVDTLSGNGSWTRYVCVLSIPEGKCLALRTASTWNLDALVLHRNTVSQTSVSEIGKTTARVAWTLLHPDSVMLEYMAVASATADFAEGSGTMLHAVDNSLLSGLTAGTHYAVHISPLSDTAGDGCHRLTLHFRTAADSVTTPYCVNFDDLGNGGYPDNWRRLSTQGEYPIASNERSHSPLRALRFSAKASTYTIALLPEISSGSDHVTLAFWTNARLRPSGAKLIIGRLSDISDVASFTPTDTIFFSTADTWEHHLIDLGANHSNVAMMLVGGSSSETRVFVDDLCVEPCVARNIRVTSVSSTTAAIRWDGDGVDTLVCHVTGGGLDCSYTLHNSPDTVRGLIPNQTHRFTFRALCDCGDWGGVYRNTTTGNATTDQSATVSINTHPTVQSVPYCNTFEGAATGSFPGNWRRQGSATVSDRNYHNGSHSIMLGNNSTVILPPMSDVGQLVATLHLYASNDAALASGAVQLGVMTNPDSANTFTAATTLPLQRSGEWERFAIPLSAFSGGNGNIALRLSTDDTCTLYVDDIGVSTCGIASAAVSSLGEVSWQGVNSPSSVYIEFGPQGFSQGNGTQRVATSSPYFISELASGSSFDVYLTTHCGNKVDCIPLKLSIGNTSEPPYCEMLDDAPLGGMPSNWLVGRSYGNTPALQDVDGNRVMALKGHSDAANRSIVVLPQMTVDMNGLQLALSMRSASGNARLAVGTVDNNADPNSFSIVTTLINSNNDVWEHKYLPLTNNIPANRRLALCCISAGPDTEVWIDSVSITTAHTPTISATSARSLVISNTSGISDYYLEYGPQGFTQGNGTLLHVTSNPYTLHGLTPEQSYSFYAREDENTPTCMRPIDLTMPAEVGLPYCEGAVTFSRHQLPELNIDYLNQLHLYVTLLGGSDVAVGVMTRSNDWIYFIPVDTLSAPAGTRRTLHVSLAGYGGSGRFVGLRTLAGGNATVESIVATSCEWPTATLQSNNTLLVSGIGTFVYDVAGFDPGNAPGQPVNGSRTFAGLADNTVYDFYPLCGNATLCYGPQKIQTSMIVGLPYCTDFSAGLPAGWALTSDAINDNAVHVADDNLVFTVSGEQQVEAALPITNTTSVVVDIEVLFTSPSVSLVIGDSTVSAPTNEWQSLRVRATHDGRLRLRAIGEGSVRVRHIEVSACALPRQLNIGQPGNGIVVADWDPSDADAPFVIDYNTENGTSQSRTTIVANQPPVQLSMLPNQTYYINLRCGLASTTCRQPIVVNTLGQPEELPYCNNFEEESVNAPVNNWSFLTTSPEGYAKVAASTPYEGAQHVDLYNLSGESYLILPQFTIDSLRKVNIEFYARFANSNGHSVTLGVMGDARNTASFDSLTSFTSMGGDYVKCSYALSNYYGNSAFIALRVKDDDLLSVDHLSVSTCYAANYRMTETEDDHVTFTWDQQGSPAISIEYGPRGFEAGSGTTLTPSNPPCTISGLSTLTDYAFYIISRCANTPCRPTTTDTFYTFIPQGSTGCIDHTDLTAPYVVCKYGTFDNPGENTGVVNYGYQSANSRHTIHFDTTERDARTGGLLRTVPEGEQAAVRLGNWTTGGNGTPQAESITYGMTVDTNEFNLLVLKYAAVLQDPEHGATMQPRFRLEILNQNNELIDSCGMAFFIANPNLHWNIAANEVLWKDWTTVGLDLSNYSGQTIYVRLTTYDCGEGSHFGYAYFTLSCAVKQMSTESCGPSDNNKFTVPDGFNYRWYTNLDTTTQSTASSITVSSDNSTIYYCDLSFVDKPECNFTMSAFAGARFPLAQLDTSLVPANCEFDLTLYDRSTVTSDGHTPIGTGERTESTLWILPDGSTSTQSNVTYHQADTGLCTITLISGIANNMCLDTLVRTINIQKPFPAAEVTGPSRRCTSERPSPISVLNDASHSWGNGSTGILEVSPRSDTTITVYTVDRNGCPDTLTHTLQVYSSYHFDYIDSVCNNVNQYQWLDTLIHFNQMAGVLHRTRTQHTVNGCDSVRDLSLRMMPTYNIMSRDTICQDATLLFHGDTLHSTGTYYHMENTAFGCDSVLIMNLSVIPRVYSTQNLRTCDSLTWIDGHTYYSDTLGARDTLTTVHGCDSVVILALTIQGSTVTDIYDTFCHGTTYNFRGQVVNNGGYYTDTLSTVRGCDSIIGLHLHQLAIPSISFNKSYDCKTLVYRVEAVSDVPYLHWTSHPLDTSLTHQQHDTVIFVKPGSPTIYSLYADYGELPRCPNTDTITVSPALLLDAEMEVSPSVLSAQKLKFEAWDVTQTPHTREWYFDEVLQSDTSDHVNGKGNKNNDSVRIMLIAYNQQCSDTALTILPLLHSVVVAPNAFTPDADDVPENKYFYFVGKGIEKAEIYIYNRMGKMVYHSNDFNQRWDGVSDSGVRCPQGNYVWQIFYTSVLHPDEYHEQTGSVLLIR